MHSKITLHKTWVAIESSISNNRGIWKIVKGSGTVEVQNKKSSINEGDNIIIPSIA